MTASSGADRSRTVAVVGGGISGLAVAEAIERKSAEAGTPLHAIILEAEAEAGGRIKSAREDGFVLDTGPHGFLDREPAAFALIDRLKLRATLIRADDASAKRYIVREGKLRAVPASPPAFLASDVLPFAAKMRVLAEPLAKARPKDVDETVWSFAARRIGETAADVLVDAMVTGIYGGDPKQLSLVSAFPRMRELEDQYGSLIKAQIAIAKEKGKSAGQPGAPAGTLHSFKDGLGELTGALARRGDVRANARAMKIEKSGAGYRVETAHGTIEAAAVILTVPAFEAGRLLEPHAPEEARSIAAIPYVPIAVVLQGYRRTEMGLPPGFGFLAPHGEGRKILGSIFASTVFPPHVPEGAIMTRTMIGGKRSPELVALDDTALTRIAREELSAIVGLNRDARPVFERVVRWPQAIPQYEVGHAERVASAEAVEARLCGVFVTGNAFRGVAMIACIAEAEKVAARAVAYLAAQSGGDAGAAA